MEMAHRNFHESTLYKLFSRFFCAFAPRTFFVDYKYSNSLMCDAEHSNKLCDPMEFDVKMAKEPPNMNENISILNLYGRNLTKVNMNQNKLFNVPSFDDLQMSVAVEKSLEVKKKDKLEKTVLCVPDLNLSENMWEDLCADQGHSQEKIEDIDTSSQMESKVDCDKKNQQPKKGRSSARRAKKRARRRSRRSRSRRKEETVEKPQENELNKSPVVEFQSVIEWNCESDDDIEFEEDFSGCSAVAYFVNAANSFVVCQDDVIDEDWDRWSQGDDDVIDDGENVWTAFEQCGLQAAWIGFGCQEINRDVTDSATAKKEMNDVEDRIAEANKKWEDGLKENCGTKKNHQIKKVHFGSDMIQVRNLITWSYAHQAARKGHWESYARDRDRFQRRIQELDLIISPILASDHREKMYKKIYG